MENETVWLPDGYGTNAIVFDKKGNPYQTIKKVSSGVNIWELKKIDILEANQKIASGYYSVLKSNED